MASGWACACLACIAFPAAAQSDAISSGTIAGGGGTSSGGGYSITDTIGQAVVGEMTGGGFVLTSGSPAPLPNNAGVTNLYAVTNLMGSGPGSLSNVLTNAPPGASITFSANLNGTISLTSPLLINKDLNISGPSAGSTNAVVLSGGGQRQVFNLIGGNVSICNLGIANGFNATNGGGVFNCAVANFCNCTFSNHQATGKGGAVYNCGGASVSFNNCTFVGCSSQSGGGALDSFGTAGLTNCTIASNTVTAGDGGGLSAEPGSSLSLNSCTVCGNTALSGGGIYDASGQLMIQNTIVAGNTIVHGGHGPDIWNNAGPSLSGGFNLIGADDASSGWSQGLNDQFGTSTAPIYPLLARLQNYDGPTPTMALLPGSPAIDTGLFAAPNLYTDQRGYGRWVSVLSLPSPPGDSSDIGAFEVQPGYDVTEPPGLQIQQSGADIFVIWPVIAKAYTLEVTATIASPKSWQPAVGTFDTFKDDSGTTYNRYLTPGGPAAFYRLRAP